MRLTQVMCMELKMYLGQYTPCGNKEWSYEIILNLESKKGYFTTTKDSF